MLRNRVIWFDLETGGLNPFHHPIIEIAALDNFGNAFQSLLRIDKPLDPKVVQITKITDELLQSEGRNYDSVIHDFHKYISGGDLRTNHRTFMIAHNGDSFDRMFIKTAFKNVNLSVPNNIYFIDSLHLARMVMPERTSYKQEYLAEKFGIKNPKPHRAMGDVLVLQSIWDCMAELFGSKNNSRNDIIAIYNAIYF